PRMYSRLLETNKELGRTIADTGDADGRMYFDRLDQLYVHKKSFVAQRASSGRQPDPSCYRRHPVVVDEEKQVVTRWSDVPVRWRSSADRGRCRAGDYAAYTALVLV